MAWQLIFTSAPTGLNPGSSGYCTVARSQGMREAVASRLEQWSVYTRPARGPSPVVCAMRVLDLRGTTFYVLTRIVDSGLDYTGRTNFLAHHLVVQRHELEGAPSPTDVFLNRQIWSSQWSAEPQWLEDVFLQSLSPISILPARHWEQAAGDAGAAALAVNETGTAAQPVDFVTTAGQEEALLPLYGESSCLLDADPAMVWNTPFTTYLQPENDPADFRWRGLWAGNRQHLGGLRIDFAGGSLPAVPQNAFAQRARTGRRPLSVGSSRVAEIAAVEEPISSDVYTAPNWKKASPQAARSPSLKEAEVSRWTRPKIALASGLALVCLALSIVLIIRLVSTPKVLGPIASTPPPASVQTPNPTRLEQDQSVAQTTPEADPTPMPQPTASVPIVSSEPLPKKLEPDPALAAIDPGEAVYVAFGRPEIKLPIGNPLARLFENDRYRSFRVAVIECDAKYNIVFNTPLDPPLLYNGFNFDGKNTMSINTDDRALASYSFHREGAEIEDTEKLKLICFFPKALNSDPNFRPFRLIISKTAPLMAQAAIHLPRRLLVEKKEADIDKVVIEQSEEFKSHLSRWLDQQGNPLRFELSCQYPNSDSSLTTKSATEIDFYAIRHELEKKLDAKVSSQVPAASSPVKPQADDSFPDLEAIRQETSESITYFCGKNGLLDSVHSDLPSPLTGKEYYNFLRTNLVIPFCQSPNPGVPGKNVLDLADQILPGTSKSADRFDNLVKVPDKIKKIIDTDQRTPPSHLPHDFKHNAAEFATRWSAKFNEKTLADYKNSLQSDLPAHKGRAASPSPSPPAFVDPHKVIQSLSASTAGAADFWLVATISGVPVKLIIFDNPTVPPSP